MVKISEYLKSRKLSVWIISFGIIFIVYLIYNQFSGTPEIVMEEPAGEVSDGNESVADSNVGMVGSVGVGTVKRAELTHLNKDKEVDRVFGFEKLLHQEGAEWEIEKPFMNIFRHNLKCYLTADKGTVTVETALGRVSPKDATLTGNVVMHIVPEGSSNIKEGFLYLDDIVFISERSQFTTAGPVKYISENARLEGMGLEIIYNDELDRLDFLRLVRLDSLKFKLPQQPVTLTGNDANQPQQNSSSQPAQAGQNLPSQTVDPAHAYKCLFSKNAVVSSSDQVVAADEIIINNIFQPKESRKEALQQPLDGNEPKAADANASGVGEPNKVGQFYDVMVTCDNGIFLVPMDETLPKDACLPATGTAYSWKDRTDVNSFFAAQKIFYDYGAAVPNAVAIGPLQLRFKVNDIARTGKTVPVKMTADEKATFVPSRNEAVFEGECLCTMFREETGFQQEYNLSADKIAVYLTGGRKGAASSSGIDRLIADGRLVQLSAVKKSGQELLGFVKLKCFRFDYNDREQMFLATGPGIIASDNSKISKPKTNVGKFSLRNPSYAIVENFETLKYFTESGKIIADSNKEVIQIGYMPAGEKDQDQRVIATAGHFEAGLEETATGQSELATLHTTGGITYEEKEKQFEGSELFYDRSKSLITVQGSEFQSCLLNGVPVDEIEYDVKNDRVRKTKLTGPGIFR